MENWGTTTSDWEDSASLSPALKHVAPKGNRVWSLRDPPPGSWPAQPHNYRAQLQIQPEGTCLDPPTEAQESQRFRKTGLGRETGKRRRHWKLHRDSFPSFCESWGCDGERPGRSVSSPQPDLCSKVTLEPQGLEGSGG